MEEADVLRIAWSVGEAEAGQTSLAPGDRFVLARRMGLPAQQRLAVERLAGSSYVFVRVPHVSDPALVITATDAHPDLHRGQRANGAIVEVTTPTDAASTPAPGQRVSLTVPGTTVELRFPDFAFEARVDFDLPRAAPAGTGTVQLGVDSLESDDTWLIAALAVALSPDHGVVAHGELKRAFALWRGEAERSDGAFDRNLLRPALEVRGVELPGPRLNKIVYLVERCRRTSEFPPRLLADIRARLTALGWR